MNARHRLGIALLGTWLALSAGAGAAAPARLGTASVDPRGALGSPALTVTPFGGTIDVAITGDEETDPAVAVCASNQYLAVYVRGTDIYGQRLTSEGALLGAPFLISDGITASSRPDVACEWTSDVFVVVYEYTYSVGDDDVRIQAVYGAHQVGGQLLGGVRVISDAPTLNERNPAIACNSDDQSCLVAYESEEMGSGDNDIYGRRVEITGAGITVPLQPPFEISGATAEHEPDLAWSDAAQNYLVVWQHWFVNVTPPSHWVLTYRRIHDTHQAGIQWQEPAYGLIRGTCGGYDNDQTVPAVAYSRGAGEYLVAYQYDFDAAGDYDVGASRVLPGVGNWPDCPFFVAETGHSETNPAVAYSGGPEHFTHMHGNPQFLVAFERTEVSEMAIYAQPVKDRDDGSGVDLDGSLQELDRIASADGAVTSPDVTGSAHNGRYLTVWQRSETGAGVDRDILGHILAPYGGVLSVAGTSFVAGNSANQYFYEVGGGLRLTGPNPPEQDFYASVELPDGATITSLTLYYHDSLPNDAIGLDLMKYDRTGGNGIMASVSSSNDGTSSKTDFTVISPTVDNASYGYALQAYLGAEFLTLYGAKITYIPNASAAIGPFAAAPPPIVAEAAAERTTDVLGEEGPVLRTGGRVVPLAAPAQAGGGARRAGDVVGGAGSISGSGLAQPAGATTPGGLGPFHWKRYPVAGSVFHPINSDTEHGWVAGGGRYVSAPPNLTSLVAPLNLIHGKTIHRARFTYYDAATANPGLTLYRVDRQSNWTLLWDYTPDASGGYFRATSPWLGEVVDNHNYAYYFIAILSAAASTDLRAMEVEISYVSDIYLPLVVLPSAVPPAPRLSGAGETGAQAATTIGHLSIVGASFVPEASATVYQTDSSSGAVSVVAVSEPYMHAPVLLPDGARIDSMTFLYYDAHAAFMTAGLTVNNATGGSSLPVSVSSAGAGGTGNTVKPVAGPPLIVDNASYNYEIEVTWHAATSDLRLRGIEIHYSTP